MTVRKNFHDTSQGLLNPGFMQEKVQKGNFLKKPFLFNVKIVYTIRWRLFATPDTTWWLDLTLKKNTYHSMDPIAEIIYFKVSLQPPYSINSKKKNPLLLGNNEYHDICYFQMRKKTSLMHT